jgi:hypothetical protein
MGSSSPALLPADVRRDGERLFDVELWCLGRDVAHGGNLLLRRGLTRERLPPGQPGTSAYFGSLPGGGALTLWGFGALCRVCGQSVYVPRDGFTPRLVEEAQRLEHPVFQAEALGPLRPPELEHECQAARTAVVELAQWLAEHEEWVVQEVGPTWRHSCLADRRKVPPVAPSELARAWRDLAEKIRVPRWSGRE